MNDWKKVKKPGPPSVEREMVVMNMLKERKAMLKQISIARNLSMTQIVEHMIIMAFNQVAK
jgi:hypothetical protein